VHEQVGGRSVKHTMQEIAHHPADAISLVLILRRRAIHGRHVHCLRTTAELEKRRWLVIGKKFAALLGLAAVLAVPLTAHAQCPLCAVQPPWQFADVGAVGTPGNAQQSPSGIAVSGAGGDIWGAADSFSFVYQPLRDGRVDTRASSESNTSPFAKAGV